jgi:hypothetical protein
MYTSPKKEDLQANAALIRSKYLGKPIRKSNVAIAEIHLNENISFCVGATSKAGREPLAPKPPPKSQGGQFEPSTDSYSKWVMDTDAEYKVLSEIASTLEVYYPNNLNGKLYLYTELKPCQSCEGILNQFQEKFLNISIEIFWDHPYPRIK